MKNSKLIIAAGALGVLITSTADAALLGIYYQLFVGEPPGGPGPPPTGNARVIYRVYAQFSSTTDRVNAWGIGGDFGAGLIKNLNPAMNGPGSGFTNIGGTGGDLAPLSPGTPRDWDSYATIGVLYGKEAPNSVDATTIIAGTPQFITNGATSWPPNQTSGGYFISPNDPQGRADYRVSGQDTDHRVLLAQLVVNLGQHIVGTIGVAWQSEGQRGQITTGLTFGVPGPGGLALLTFAGLLDISRRRRS